MGEKKQGKGNAPHWSGKWELVVGLEVHAQLLTESKAYSSDPNAYGDRPNTLAGPVTLGLPGTLPVPNMAVIDHAIKLGLACGCTIAPRMHYARKNYFYPDLPKGYQVTQDTTPICTGGHILITEEDGTEKAIALTRIHMEEDAGKSIHDVDPFNTLVDLNRAGVPLVEIVSEPVIRSAQEAYDYLVEVRRLVRYLDICDGNMEEGSLRCDANISLRPKGTTPFGTRTEVKNMNSFRNVQRAIEHEAQRQSEILDAGGTIAMETRNFDAAKGITTSLRSKEMAHDYRYFPEPDLLPLTVSEAKKESVRKTMPPLPRDLRAKYTKEYGLSTYDADILTDDKGTALYYEDVVAHTKAPTGTKPYKHVANWVMGEVRSWVNEHGASIAELPVSAIRLAGLVDLVEAGKISRSLAAQKLFPLMVGQEGTAAALAEAHNLLTDADHNVVEAAVQQAMARYPDKVAAYRAGNKGLLGLFMGEVMKATQGKADPRTANNTVKRLLDEQ
ncbi:MAG: Asp-tRNA(Asn)/Glu-tRNA(Gln) amidotransferase subunit GatB [Flavobacteriales bacterium]|nr:Asp-tRNA(Asn)/Glu-tRNA(Gln) amidotransferase subunit GatB [Flavobacteriales bacterium]MBP9079467.1 Asp-tRNA(Asn)/Glu-tRNA(Gln) amidotransferase subunit GatB [Flavobacteriales bacterium]